MNAAVVSGFWLAFLCLMALALVFGFFALIAPRRARWLADVLNRWISVERVIAPLDSPHRIDRIFYRHHRSLGILMVFGAGYVLFTLPTAFQPEAIATGMNMDIIENLLTAVLEGVRLLFGLGCVFALIIGVFMLVRPSSLKGLEAWANRWISTDVALQHLDRPRLPIDRLFENHYRVLGVFVVLGSVFALALWLTG